VARAAGGWTEPYLRAAGAFAAGREEARREPLTERPELLVVIVLRPARGVFEIFFDVPVFGVVVFAEALALPAVGAGVVAAEATKGEARRARPATAEMRERMVFLLVSEGISDVYQ